MIRTFHGWDVSLYGRFMIRMSDGDVLVCVIKLREGAEISHPACRQLFCYKSGRGHIVNHGRVNEG